MDFPFHPFPFLYTEQHNGLTLASSPAGIIVWLQKSSGNTPLAAATAALGINTISDQAHLREKEQGNLGLALPKLSADVGAHVVRVIASAVEKVWSVLPDPVEGTQRLGVGLDGRSRTGRAIANLEGLQGAHAQGVRCQSQVHELRDVLDSHAEHDDAHFRFFRRGPTEHAHGSLAAGTRRQVLGQAGGTAGGATLAAAPELGDMVHARLAGGTRPCLEIHRDIVTRLWLGMNLHTSLHGGAGPQWDARQNPTASPKVAQSPSKPHSRPTRPSTAEPPPLPSSRQVSGPNFKGTVLVSGMVSDKLWAT